MNEPSIQTVLIQPCERLQSSCTNAHQHGLNVSSPERSHIAFASGAAIGMLRERAGNAMVELALMMPFFAIMLIALIKCGFAVNNYLTLENAVSQGVYAVANSASDPTITTDPCALAYRTVSNVVASNFDPQQLVFSLKLNNPQSTFTGIGSTFSCAESQSGSLKSVDADQPVVLTVSYPLDLNIIGYRSSSLSVVDLSTNDLMSATAQQNVQVVTQ